MVVEHAYARCLQLARRHYENFPVASRFVPKGSRHHIAAIYAFARTADDLADEGDEPPGARLAKLETWQWRVEQAAKGVVEDDGTEAAAIFTAVAATIKTCQLETSLFTDLLSAFAQDVLVKRYDSWTDVLDYCRRSANPVGRLVLRVSGHRSATTDAQSDAICTALQLVNFWQDLQIDWSRGRLYVPRELVDLHGADTVDLDRGEWTAGWRAALADAGQRTRALFLEGRPVTEAVRGRLRWELRATWLGGVRVLDRLEAIDYNVFRRRPTLGWGDAPVMLWRAIRWRTA